MKKVSLPPYCYNLINKIFCYFLHILYQIGTSETFFQQKKKKKKKKKPQTNLTPILVSFAISSDIVFVKITTKIFRTTLAVASGIVAVFL